MLMMLKLLMELYFDFVDVFEDIDDIMYVCFKLKKVIYIWWLNVNYLLNYNIRYYVMVILILLFVYWCISNLFCYM